MARAQRSDCFSYVLCRVAAPSLCATIVLSAVSFSALAQQQWQSGYDITVQRAAEICRPAVLYGATSPLPEWDLSPRWADYVAEARRRGYTPQYCVGLLVGVLLPLPPPPVVAAPAAPSPQPPPPDPLVVSIQTLLGVLGYDVGVPDGFAGPRTGAAVAAFQQKIGERADGRPSEALRVRLQTEVAERGPGASGNPSAGAPSPRQTKPASSGTGFFVGGDILITNHHVIDGCVEIRMRKHNAEIGSARVIAANRADDVAALPAQ